MRLARDLRDDFIQREMRTHGRKNGYVTKGQSERLARWLPLIGLGREQTLADASFAQSGPVVLEIGFGNGEFLEHLAVTNPGWNIVGVEIYLPGIAKAISRLEQVGVVERVRISQLPAQYVVSHQIPDESLHGVVINNPDPWPKARHHKRRLIQKDFAQLLVQKLEPGGFIKLATDIEELAEWMRDILDETPGLTNVAGKGGYVEREAGRPVTKFEERGNKAGREARYLHYIRGESQ